MMHLRKTVRLNGVNYEIDSDQDQLGARHCRAVAGESAVV